MHYILAPVNVYFLWFLDINCKALISLSLIKEISTPGGCNYRCQGLPILEVGLAQMFTEIGRIKRQYKVDLIYIWFIFVAKSRSFMRLNIYAVYTFIHVHRPNDDDNYYMWRNLSSFACMMTIIIERLLLMILMKHRLINAKGK